ncbi:hypothetical protein Patl1_01939 [Pistacia atlantica]|uniref:Uncharacterized protein n=1 Tax=Pistacia atlantica TaxID=434234 RepID=A0ACC1CAZ3_9ROSI|nr:hypothetical protein Patl1_01939 [Pistacia atlantica]
MNGLERSRRWNNLKQRLGFNGMGCCGAIWSRPRIQTITDIIQQEETGIDIQNQEVSQQPTPAAGSGMNLAMALAAERNLRDGDNVGPPKKDAGTVKSLMMLIEETDGDDWKKRKNDVGGVEAGKLGGGSDWGMFKGIVAESRLLSHLQPFDSGDP